MLIIITSVSFTGVQCSVMLAMTLLFTVHVSIKLCCQVPSVADPELAKGGGKVERRRREYRGAEGA